MSKKIVRAKEFILEDEQGRARGGIKTDEQGNTALHFEDDEGKTRLYAGLTIDGTPRIGLQFAQGHGSIQLEASDKLNAAGINIQGPSGTIQVMIGVAANGLPAIALFDPDGNLLFPRTPNKNKTDKNEPKKPDDPQMPFSFDWDSILDN